MVRVRREVRSLGPDWPDTLLWYAVAVRTLQSRPFTDPTSWRFLAAMHGWHPLVWRRFGVIQDGEPVPADNVQTTFMNQCQHQTWYFLPWHRGYVSAVEQILRDAVVQGGGPTDWALPYWDYSDVTDPQARRLPPAFSAPSLPDGTPNPLRVARRFGGGTVPIVIPAPIVGLEALELDDFTGGTADIPPGFGGPATLFHHGPESDSTNGGLESSPHNGVHGAIGGSAPGTDPNVWQNWGLMSAPFTAALDPIFWLHHANIDRLWTTWRRAHPLPDDPNWLTGPPDRTFVMPQTDGGVWEYTASDVLDTTEAPMDYVYDDEGARREAPSTGADRRRRRLEALEAARVPGRRTPRGEGADVDASRGAELIGASDGSVRISGETRDDVRMDRPRTGALQRSLDRAMVPDNQSLPEPARVFLKLEGIRGTADSANYYVYIDLPSGCEDADPRERLAGTLSLFGVSAASDENGPNAGSGVNQVIEISEIVDALHISGDRLDALHVRFVPASEDAAAADFTVGRIAVFMLAT